jgi:hypothetical protein
VRHLGVTSVVAVAAAVLLLGTATASFVDHRRYRERANHRELDEWYCEHLEQRCGRGESRAVEERWERRERVYKISMGSSGAVMLSAAGVVLWRRRARRRDGREACT